MGHTPGPWTVKSEDDDGELYDDGVRIDSPDGPVAFNVIDCSAHLIAAAPEMLDALKSIERKWRCGDGAFSVGELCRQVIAKAEGRTSDANA